MGAHRGIRQVQNKSKSVRGHGGGSPDPLSCKASGAEGVSEFAEVRIRRSILLYNALQRDARTCGWRTCIAMEAQAAKGSIPRYGRGSYHTVMLGTASGNLPLQSAFRERRDDAGDGDPDTKRQ